MKFFQNFVFTLEKMCSTNFVDCTNSYSDFEINVSLVLSCTSDIYLKLCSNFLHSIISRNASTDTYFEINVSKVLWWLSDMCMEYSDIS